MPMAELRTTFESAGCRSVRTYIQSGNVVFASPTKSRQNLSKRLGDAIEEQFGFRPSILLLSLDDFCDAVAKNPFLDAVAEPKTLHFFFLDSVPNSPDMKAIDKLAVPTERFELIGEVFYLYTPDGFGRSKLAASAERKLGVTANDDLPWERRDHALFVAFAPADKPRLAVALIVEHGGGGSAAAAPIVRDIVLQALYQGFPPLSAYPQSQRQRIENERKELKITTPEQPSAIPTRA